MIKVMVVDDNMLIRQSLIHTIPWAALGCEVVGEAADGVEALALAASCLPDFVVTDIRMPEMDGLELTERVKALVPGVKVIIITGYDDFSYAQRAIKLGAFDLVLKPIDNAEIEKTFRRAVEAHERDEHARAEQRRVLEERESLRGEVSRSAGELRRKRLIDRIGGLADESESEESLKALQLDFQRHATFIVRMDPAAEGSGATAQLAQACTAALEELGRSARLSFVSFWISGGFVTVAAPHRPEPDKTLNVRMMELCTRLAGQLREESDLRVVIGISNVHGGIGEVRQSYDEAVSAIDCRFFIDNRTVIHAGVLQSRSIVHENPIMKRINRLFETIRSGDGDLEALLDGIFQEIRENETTDAGYVKGLLTNICMSIGRIPYEKGVDGRLPVKSSAEIHADIQAFTNITQAFQYVRTYALAVSESLDEGRGKRYSPVTGRIMDYLNQNYDRKVTLQEIADHVALSPAHVSRIVRRDTGESVVDLFNGIKIQIAMKLLKTTNLKVYEVANRVGIENYAYFYQLFKKATGVSPSEFHGG